MAERDSGPDRGGRPGVRGGRRHDPADAPLRAELLTLDRLADAAAALARTQETAPARGRTSPSPLPPLVARIEEELEDFESHMTAAIRRRRSITPATEWLLDNSYLVEEQLRLTSEDFPPAYADILPRLAAGPLAGYPRVYDLAVSLVAHTDSRVDTEELDRFVAGFQRSVPLDLGEVWAIPIVLRIALLENLRRLAALVARSSAGEQLADDWADRLLLAAQDHPDGLPALLKELSRHTDGLAPSFYLRLLQRMRDQEDIVTPIVSWVERQMQASGVSLEAYVSEVQQRRAANQVSIANAITSLRFLGALDWRAFFERHSIVEQVLREDPVGTYERMDFVSRDRYRHAVEELAKRSPHSEIEVAEAAVSSARSGLGDEADDTVRAHVGYYLVSRGRYGFEAALGYRPTARERAYRGPLHHHGFIYWGSMLLSVFALIALAGWYALAGGASHAVVGLVMLLGLIPMSELALTLTNRLAALLYPARALLKLDFTRPVDPSHRTLVIVPSLLTSVQGVSGLLDHLEVTYLANADPDVHLALLGDLRAADTEHTPADEGIIAAARVGIEELNERYRAVGGADPFHLFIRGRRYDAEEGTWMGWERKRGAIVELNRRLRGASDTSFTVVEGDASFLPGVTFVITLDADTVLPRDAARQLISTIAHPLNRARFDADVRRVVHGYGLVQPHVAMSLPSSRQSHFSKLYTGLAGIDPYSGAISDTYQDVFGEGSFTGKGIYEVNVFLAALEGRIPDDTLLSHDLVEGSFLRTGLASDVEVFDDYPSTYLAQTARLHRWVRGDWQTLPWLGNRVPDADGKAYSSPLSPLHRWKLADNLRRSLLAPSIVAFVALGWWLVPHPGWAWPAIVFLILFAPAYLRVGDLVVFYPRGFSLPNAVTAAWSDLREDLGRSAMALVLLPHQAQVMLDAISRALWRQLVSRRNMLEWVTAAEAELAHEASPGAYVARMLPASLVASALLVPAAVAHPDQLPLIVPAWLTWLAAPVVAWWMSQPLPRERPLPTARERATMRRIARKTWRYFDRFVTADDHWLVPDNYQEDVDRVAHRTSPTNIGLQLLTYLTAYDLGYVCVANLVERVSHTLNAMTGLELFRGHFYNWYDTRSLEPLRPTYVSTVDSGNLVGHLLALRVGLLEASERPLVGPQVLDGLADTLRLADEALLTERGTAPAAAVDSLREPLEELQRRVGIEEPPRDLGVWWTLLAEFAAATADVPARLAALPDLPPDTVTAVLDVTAEIAAHRADLTRLAAWAPLLPEIPPAVRDAASDALAPLLAYVPSLAGLAEGLVEVLASLEALAADPPGQSEEERTASASWCARAREGILACRPDAIRLLAELRLAAHIAQETWERTDFTLLYDAGREVFSIGYNVAEGRLDNSFYDLLASECRLASYVAVAKGDVPQRHWFKLARPLTKTDLGYALISWSASMFEYLMPLLVMRDWQATLLDETYRAVVGRQVQYGRQRGVPWGVSESAFNARDAEGTYQYQAFGVPGLGLKRGLSEDAVVAPYASLIALPVDLRAALANLAVLSRAGGEGPYGFYEAIDFTPGRVPAGAERAVVYAYFAHHQGMSFTSLGNTLNDMRMQRRFMADPVVQSAELLLQEKVPRHVIPAAPHVEEVEFVRSVRELPPPVTRTYPLADTPAPATHFLSNGRYSVMVTNAGGGYSRYEDVAVTRYREDITRDCWGTFFYLRDLESGAIWSAGHQPTLVHADEYHVVFAADKAEYRRIDGHVETHMEVVVSPEDDVEVRRITVTNHGRRVREIEVTSYFEISLADQAADQAHRTFSNLFLETESLPDLRTVLFTRRPRSADEKRRWGVHTLACEATETCESTCETDRARFLGRLGSVVRPRAVYGDEPLSGSVGAVLDPVCAIRQKIRVAPGESARLQFTTGVAESREKALALAQTYGDTRSGLRAADLAWTSSQIELRDLGLSPDEAVVFQRLGSRLLLTDPYGRLKAKTPVENELPISGLWGLGISGDHPILLVKVDDVEEVPLVRQLLLAHQYWRHKGLVVDLVVLNTKPSAYLAELDGRLQLLVRTGHALQLMDKPGGVFIRKADQIDPSVRNLLESVARVVLNGDAGPLLVQLDQRGTRPEPPDRLFAKASEPREYPQPALELPELAFPNGLGGFDLARNEYVVVLREGETTPAPWINVMANEEFGSMVSEAGIGCTWAVNSHENRLTTWNNDPVADGSGESLYVRDEDTGEFWSPTALPVRDADPYVIRHGRGYSVFEHTARGIAHELTYFVAADAPVRFARLKLTNLGDDARHLSVTQLVEWSLGSSRSKAQHRVVTSWDDHLRVLTAHNWFNEDFPGRPAFLACDRDVDSWTAWRTEFLGRNGWPADPAAMHRRGLGGVCGRYHDNCGALLTKLALEPGESTTVCFLLGQAGTAEETHELVERFRDPGAVDGELERVRAFWDEVLGTLTVETPDAMLDAMVNGPALYQTLACRVWGRTALYQSSGAFGFRDQLQDSLALLLARPEETRARIVEASRHQFPEGDVLHWWMPVSGRGVRTRISDDRHWLAYVTAEYIARTGDTTVLDEVTPYLDGPLLPAEREDLYLAPKESLQKASVWEHILAATETGRQTGQHDLPLMGGGDWNDGMNHVGHLGRGESVWLAWFLVVVLGRLANLARLRGDTARAADSRRWADDLVRAVETHAWDGAWYLRAFFDDGTPLGTKSALECRIDSVAQSWAVFAGKADHGRVTRAMAAVEEKLVRWEDGLVALLTPPFDHMPEDPGYIKGYVPGVRENGGQYTHAALWVVMAYTALGDGDQALELLDLLNPISHAGDPEGCERYKVEPYVVAADVYAVEPHVGRGGWTWYTGSASWFYTVATRHLLGIRVETEGDTSYLVVDPCIPKDWPGFRATLRFGTATYEIRVENPRGVNRGVELVRADGVVHHDDRVPLADDGAVHKVRVVLLGG